MRIFEYAKLRDFTEGERVFTRREFDALKRHVKNCEFEKARAIAKRYGSAVMLYTDYEVDEDGDYAYYGDVIALVKPRDGLLLGIIVSSADEE